MQLAHLNDREAENDKNGIIIRPLRESFEFIALMAKAQKLDYNSVWALLK